MQGLPLSELADHPLVRHPALVDLFMHGQVAGVAFFDNRTVISFAPSVDLNVVMIGLAATFTGASRVEKTGNSEITITT